MTKKPSEKNKAWEKDRRDRLNKTFDELAKLLPKFDPSIVWSKIEIIQKAISFIEYLLKKQEDYLKTKDPEFLKDYNEFANCLRFYQERNSQLTELLKKAKITLPPIVLPKLIAEKPELLPKEENASAIGSSLQKPKKQRNRTKKSDSNAKELTNNEDKKTSESKFVTEEISVKADVTSIKPSFIEGVTKPTAIITAFERETLKKSSNAIQLPIQQLSSPVPAKHLLLRLKKNRKCKIRFFPKTIFRKFYPHPGKLLQWKTEATSQRKLVSKRRISKKKSHLCKRKTLKNKINFPTEPQREQTVSPTAAFLLSFPVVTSSVISGKNVENGENSVNLENLNNFFATEEYSKFCDQNITVEDKNRSEIPVETVEKPQINGKPMTVFTVSEITRPCSPKKLVGNCESGTTNNRNQDPLWIGDSKLIRNSLPTSYENCYSFTDINPIIVSTTMCSSTSKQAMSMQCSSTNTVKATTVSSSSPSTASLKTSIKVEPLNSSSSKYYSNVTANFFPRYNHSSEKNSNCLKNALESPTKASKLGVNQQKVLVHSFPSSVSNLPAKSIPSKGKAISTQTTPKKISPYSNPTLTAANFMVKSTTKSSIPSFHSPSKNFFYDFPIQNESNTSDDPLISSTAVSKVNTPSIKTEYPWLQSTASSSTISTSTSTTIRTTCNQNISFTPFDLASIVCDSLTSTSLTFSRSTPKSSEPMTIEASHKGSSNNKCNQINLFVPYENVPTYTSTKATDSQLFQNARENSWKVEKSKDMSDQFFYDCEQSKPQQQKSHVNWMTSSTTDYTPASSTLPLPQIDFGNQFPNSTTNFDFNFSCRKDSFDDDNQLINWSPTKSSNADFSTAYSFENFVSNEAPPNKTVKHSFSVTDLVEQVPPQEPASVRKGAPKVLTQKATPVKQTFSNIYSAESLIAKKESSRTSNPNYFNVEATNTQSEYHTSNNYFFNYPNTQNCLPSETDYLGASAYSAPSNMKNNSILSATGGGTATAPVIPLSFESAAASSSTNYFAHSISSHNNDPYDPTYFPSSNYNHPNNANWQQSAAKGNIYNQNLIAPNVVYGAVEPSCQQNSNVSSNLTNFNLSSICPEIDGKNASSAW